MSKSRGSADGFVLCAMVDASLPFRDVAGLGHIGGPAGPYDFNTRVRRQRRHTASICRRVTREVLKEGEEAALCGSTRCADRWVSGYKR